MGISRFSGRAPAAGVNPRRGTAIPPQAAAPSVEPEALVVSHWFDPGVEGEPYSATIRLSGRRVGISGPTRASDTFVHDEAVDLIVPGSGPVSVSSWVYGLVPGDLSVSAELIRRPSASDPLLAGRRAGRPGTEPLARAVWSWRRRKLSTGSTEPLKTRWAILAPVARIPGVVPGSFTVLALLGFVVAAVIPWEILQRTGIGGSTSLVVSGFAIVVGVAGAKVWYRALHPDAPIIGAGWAVDGFLVVAPLAGLAALYAFDLPIGQFLDASAPGLFAAVAIGRLGCFFTGCCAGRCTRHPLGIWSSDRRIGARRIPTQLLESGAGLVIGVTAGILVLADAIVLHGAVFVVSLGVYLVVRQYLLRLRAEPRPFLWQRRTTGPLGS